MSYALVRLNAVLKHRFTYEKLPGDWNVEVVRPMEIDALVVRLTQTLAAMELKEIRVPATWWDHMKETLQMWLYCRSVSWLARRITYKTFCYSAAQMLPGIPINDPATGALNPVFIREPWRDS